MGFGFDTIVKVVTPCNTFKLLTKFFIYFLILFDPIVEIKSQFFNF